MPADLPDDQWLEAERQRIGKRIREIREWRNLTQEQVYLAVPMNRAHYQAIEAGQANPTLRTLLLITWVLDVDIELRGDEGPAHPPRGEQTSGAG
ncbi:helix-turn-helix transcriptional regulator [Streptomyces albogriseolus]|uniref:helix-turn-helix transcriptional regulator n=1 Tax=Streptomyces albogriseolus TaxID=1887 RepID=UPI002256A6B2|nr:helix-turn-helix transcriptional regulator [Streptomyces viridodiastaticus]MCX4622767.1 helix-turn-helix transcriptional regulator [Streptomyces viridodiastaticus]